MSKNKEVKCPNCGKLIDIEDLIEAGARETVNKELLLQEEKHRAELQKVEDEKGKLSEKIEKEHKEKLQKREVELRKKIEDENKEAQEVLEKELIEKNEKLREMNKLKADMSRLEREKQNLEEEIDAKYQKKLNENLADEKIKLKQKLQSDHELEILEYKKQLDDQKDLIEEMKRKHEQGSMQLQGEVQELAIESWLREKFPLDEISEVGKGDMGADCLQTIHTRERLNCGTIYFESKRTKKFGSTWIAKFKNDIKEKGADIGVLVTQAYPDGMDRMGLYDGIYICSYDEFKGLSMILRENIVKVSHVMKSQENRADKAALLYNFLTSNEFKIQVEGIIQAFRIMKSDLETEKAAFQKVWKKREKQLELVISNTSGMLGSIQGISNTELESEEFLSLPTLEN